MDERSRRRYPFDNYGVPAADQVFGYALETQTLSLHPRFLFNPAQFPDVETAETIMVHELAHQWYGDSVAPESWSDLWLNEGHATWYEWTYGDELFGGDFEPRGAHPRRIRAGRPVARSVRAGRDARIERALRAVQPECLRRRRGCPVRTAPGDRRARFRAAREGLGTALRGRVRRDGGLHRFASKVARRNLGPFLRDWLYGTETPPMPGHPDWEVLPVEAGAPAATVAKSQALRIERAILKR